MQFHEITAADGEWARPRLEGAGFKSCEFAFANVYMWSHVYGTEIAEYQGYVVARNIGRTHHHFLYPVGRHGPGGGARAPACRTRRRRQGADVLLHPGKRGAE